MVFEMVLPIPIGERRQPGAWERPAAVSEISDGGIETKALGDGGEKSRPAAVVRPEREHDDQESNAPS